MSDSPEELETLVHDLAETLEGLERRLDSEPQRRRTLLEFTERYAIPTTVAMLEANIRVLEAVGGAIRMADGRDPRERPRRGRETALGTLDRALSEVSEAVAGTPTDPEARELLADARALRDEIRSRVDPPVADKTGEGRQVAAAGGTTIPVADQRASPVEDDAPEERIDVDAELDTIREEVHGNRAERENETDGGDANDSDDRQE